MKNFGEVLEGLREDKKFAREGWNGKNMWIYSTIFKTETNEVIGNIGLVISTPSGILNNWIPSITDLFAEDWIEVFYN